MSLRPEFHLTLAAGNPWDDRLMNGNQGEFRVVIAVSGAASLLQPACGGITSGQTLCGEVSASVLQLSPSS